MQALHAVESLHASYPNVPVYACGTDLRHAAQLQEAGALTTVATTAEAGLSLGCRLLSAELGMPSSDIAFLKQGIDDAMAMRCAWGGVGGCLRVGKEGHWHREGGRGPDQTRGVEGGLE